MAAFTIVVTDQPFRDPQPELSAARELGAELRLGQCKTVQEVQELVDGADAILTSLAPISTEVIEELTHCRIIARYGIGVDNIDVDAATRRGIPVTNVPDYATDEVSDHALALLLTSARKIIVANQAVRAGAWGLDAVVPLHRLRGQTLGLIGLGKIARQLALKVQPFGMHVCGVDPYVAEELLTPLGVERVELSELFRRSDFISLHTPLTSETQHMIDASALAQMKSSAFLINTARGALIDEEALVNALTQGIIAGAALDVASVEPLPLSSPLRRSEKLILTPHIAYYSEESLQALQRQAVDEVKRALRGQPLHFLVNRELRL